MFSSRLQWDLRPNRIARALAELRRAGAPILDLTESNPTRAGIEYPGGLLRALEDPRALTYEPSPAGLLRAREAVAGYYAARGARVTPERILLTASTSEAYAYLFKLLADPGDSVLVPRPSYPLFEFLANLEGVEVRQYRLAYHGGWSIDLDSLAGAVTERTRAVVVVNPNNPTGSYLKRAELDALAGLCAARGMALISDEVFHDYAFAPDAGRATAPIERECLSFSMSGLSKIAGLPQMKLGWIVAGGPAELRAEAQERLEWIADTYLSVSAPVQYAAADLLACGEAVQRRIGERTAANLDFAREALAGSSANLLEVEGGWYAIAQAPRVRTEEEWALELLAREQVLVQPGFFYDFESEAFLALSLLTAPEVFRQGLARIRKMAEG
ncbi:MAG TPA: pyridoxal phosphate-dependent aminotransferase [Bryobacteraceae bacterium]|nr:pyridoxal phosphate-dependent aminotransferase [Bryobacteraceae bacterium]